MLLLFLGYVSSVTLFTHRHFIDGHTVYHSRLYSGNAEQPNHDHSSQQFKTLSAIAMYVALTASAPLHLNTPAPKATTITSDNICNVIKQCVRHFSLRAPPAII